ncbi:unnamed protein product [Acanthoscelides obtectus]|uniref:Uncharacterized protein n=1 Tax=Acanthoscelides obtectus TaxID=200917 RepID=A0A9P0L2J5_ACAOB|nr:unnamed protein product [Acanthoscelides obtectus]CAK1668680.1 UDP-glucuronosyltransferase 1-7C [Acanthoscelides obtectus]
MQTMSLITVLVVTVISVLSRSDAHNILAVVSHPGVSHFKAYENLFVGLAKKGHNVTVISHFPRKNPIPNYRDVSIREDRPYSGLQNIQSSLHTDLFGIQDQMLLVEYGIQSCESMKHKNFQMFLKENNHFDLVILNEFSNLCYRGLAKKYDAPYIGHPNVKAFIFQGGMLSLSEAAHCGVPIIAIPLYGDQPTNAKLIESRGAGVVLQIEDVNVKNVRKAVNEVLSTKIQKEAKRLSEIYRDRPLSPLDTAIYWVEYVLRHKGAHFMKTAAVHMPWYQYYLIDVIGFLVIILTSSILLTIYCIKLLVNICRITQKNKVD